MDTPSDYEPELTLDYVSSGITGLIFMFGLIFNAIAILINCVLEDYKKTSHWYVLNLAIADGIFLMMLPVAIIDQLLETWALGEPLCIAYNTVFYANYYAGIFFLTVMSIDRYAAIVHPLSSSSRKFRSKEGSWTATVAVWILAVAASIPLILNTKVISNVEGDDDDSKHCVVSFHTNSTVDRCLRAGIPPEHCDEFISMNVETGTETTDPPELTSAANDEDFPEWFQNGTMGTDPYCNHVPYPAFRTWIFTNFILTFAIPVVILVFCYGCILWRVLHPRIKSSRSSKGSGKPFLSSKSSKADGKQDNSNRRVTTLVVVLVAMFLLCWTPFHVIQIMKIWGMTLGTETCKLITDIAHILTYSNSFFNPILYTFLGANFHKRVGRAWTRFASKASSTKDFSSPKNSKASTIRGTQPKSNIKVTETSGAVGASGIDIQMTPPPPYKVEEISTSV